MDVRGLAQGILLLHILKGVILLDLQGPVFLAEPPYKVEFSNNSGGLIDCTGHGSPPPDVEWSVATTNHELVYTLPNGSLIFYPFSADKFRHEVHSTVYRCKLKNLVGTILSREVHVKGVVNQKYNIQVHDEYVMSGNTAVLKCQVPSYIQDYVVVTAWVQDSGVHLYPNSDIGGKYIVLSNGDLYINNAGASDAYKTYSCRTVNRLTGEIQISTYPGRVIVTEPKGLVQPRINVEKHSLKHVVVNAPVTLPCVAQGHPVPTYRWFKEVKDQIMPLPLNERISIVSAGLLKIAKARLEDSGKYLCWVNNTAGEETIQVSLTVTAPLTAHLQPQVQTVDVGKDAQFQCIISGFPAHEVLWMHNGKPIVRDSRIEIYTDVPRIVIKNVQKEDQGMYQCFVANEWEQIQSTAELQLGDATPELLYWFSEQTLQPGPTVSLKCVGTGNPPPQFTWKLDGFPIPDSPRFVVGQYVTIHDDVISHVNISNVKEEDGGEYTCVAQNSIGRVSHSAKVNIYGLPYIREMPKITGISGHDLIIKCPVAGYPIDKIHWERDGQTLPINRRQRAYNNGTLIIEQLQLAEDAGTYTCMAQNKQKQTARRNVEIQVIVPPKIMPIQAMTNMLREGMRAAISCQILEGDLPVNFRWERNGKPVLGTGNEVIRRLDEYSTSLVIEHITSEYSGNYTCIASNVAGSESFTVPLTVNVPPKWILEPKDSSAQAGQDVALHCQAGGHPQPTVTWKKAIGNTPGEYKDFLYEPNVSLHTNGTLQFRKIAKDSQGHFLCEAKNSIGTGVSKVIFLKVNVPAHFTTKNKQITSPRNKQIHIQCNVQGDNPIDIKWKMQSSQQQLDESLDNRYNIREQVLDDGMVSELGISHTYRQDTGVYICQASNAFGQDEMSIHLVIQEVPEAPKNLRINSQQSRTLQLSWSQPFAGNSPIEKYNVEYKLVTDSWQSAEHITVAGTQTVITLQNLKPAKAYHLRISAENKLGASEYSEVIQVTTLEEVPSGPPLNIKGEPKSSTEIFLSWEAPDRDQWNGNLLGYYVGYQIAASPNDRDINPTQGFNFKTVEVRSHFGGETTLQNLNKCTTYNIVVQAYTSQGSGPPSKEISLGTLEDVPSSAPDSPKCDVLSSTSIYITWSPPPVDGQNGKIRGYKVSYIEMDDLYEKEPYTSKTNNQYLTLENLKKFTNYTFWVLAFTKVGDGVRTNPFHCITQEDVPSAPSALKAVPSSSTKIIISWLPPAHRNGLITGYTFYMQLVDGGRDEGTHKRSLVPYAESHETVRLQEHATYQFWLTASTKVGEGEKSEVITVPPNNKVPARIVSFSQEIVTPWKETLILPCRKVGVPAPVTIWRQDDQPMDTGTRKLIAKNGTLYIKDCQHSDAGNYTCSVENTWGRDEIVYRIRIRVPPDPPTLTIVNTYTDSLLLEWTDNRNGGSPVLGYVINYKRENGDWEELQIDSKTNTHLLVNLWCGTRYQLYITAYNKIGTGLPCDIVHSHTKGLPPVQPKHSQMITNNSTSVTCWLDSWGDGGCGILHFSIENRLYGRSQWNMIASHVEATERIFTVTDLQPATKYQLRVTAYNNAGATMAVYNYTTLTAQGVMVYPDITNPVSPHMGENPFYANVKVILPLCLSILILFALVAAALLIRKRKLNNQNRIPSTSMSESPSIANIQNKHNRDQQYLAVRAQQASRNSNSVDSGSYKAEGNEYIEDICPYATFQLNKQTYSESSYSGNVYSGPYHSVRGSFVYHDVKTESYHNKEPEYTKVRRKGGSRLRDPATSEPIDINQFIESDNPGSTDSEVRKILTLHIPITEYDTLGSESDNDIASRSNQSNYRHHRDTQDETSSSSENSPSSISRKSKPPYPPRKSAKAQSQNLPKRHVRSSSGYSSHNEETTFSISNYPNYSDHITPPARFSDLLGRDATLAVSSVNPSSLGSATEIGSNVVGKKSSNHSPRPRAGQKLQREAFQINV
ncbi:cell adhesion molecule Dscam2 isoform X1 [Anopheles gambiae]|uniref:cell adhesion molecule Dscam2 isoform X1 n=1 Tax=Anopheles gambiae TaxID=7165 RepID=UPI002AC91394|nr:cell adhesion molecule Dscam2 isoform X1 [Anopheles gambiae]XP_061500111.1 cell adhesion molecule Dscam2 isoform X1 [Anopheles gambiae]XP_061500112.1 cell adhesion molecule Dscam2 isoform X1 [Anopheles gambiae]XP_061500113.1 cell adhesion molecule Dscam2 isoform X1 [Anopheles gambiae]XP_061500114.1 cell adhesion molecule Dscam2 isoform X1 [Anopheles gambiae]XP_061500115.1 cell adhesion molecule Dscam2 isoform X1 [Anopheles gambiae]